MTHISEGVVESSAAHRGRTQVVGNIQISIHLTHRRQALDTLQNLAPRLAGRRPEIRQLTFQTEVQTTNCAMQNGLLLSRLVASIPKTTATLGK